MQYRIPYLWSTTVAIDWLKREIPILLEESSVPLIHINENLNDQFMRCMKQLRVQMETLTGICEKFYLWKGAVAMTKTYKWKFWKPELSRVKACGNCIVIPHFKNFVSKVEAWHIRYDWPILSITWQRQPVKIGKLLDRLVSAFVNGPPLLLKTKLYPASYFCVRVCLPQHTVSFSKDISVCYSPLWVFSGEFSISSPSIYVLRS